MNRPQVRIIDAQQEETKSEIVTGSAADEMLKKYYQQQQQKQVDEYDARTDDNFKGFAGIEVPPQRPHDPRTDADKDGMYSNTTWEGDNELGINFEIKINSSMPLPKR